jgi:hypothetical protein
VIEETRLLVRAGFACEYCRAIITDSFELDHCTPKSLGGGDDESNLAVSCPRCNRNKGASAASLDLLTRRRVAIFHPRKQDWKMHFASFRHYVVGTSITGRATATLLFRQTRRTSWATPPPVDLGGFLNLGEDELFLRRLFNLRKQARHSEVLEHVDVDSSMSHLSRRLSGRPTVEAADITSIEGLAVAVETLTSRSTSRDLVIARGVCRTVLRFLRRLENDHPVRDRRLPYFERKMRLAERQLGMVLSLKQQTAALARGPRWNRGELHLGPKMRSLLSTGAKEHMRDVHAQPTPADRMRAARLGDPRRVFAAWDRSLATAAGSANQVERSLQECHELLSGFGYGQDTDYLLGGLMMRRYILLSLAGSALPLPSHADEWLRDLVRWGALHQVRQLTFALAEAESIPAEGEELLLQLIAMNSF